MERLIAAFINFLVLLPNLHFWERDWTLDSVYTQFCDFTKTFFIS